VREGAKPGGSSVQTVLLNPETGMVVDRVDNLQSIGGKADAIRVSVSNEQIQQRTNVKMLIDRQVCIVYNFDRP